MSNNVENVPACVPVYLPACLPFEFNIWWWIYYQQTDNWWYSSVMCSVIETTPSLRLLLLLLTNSCVKDDDEDDDDNEKKQQTDPNRYKLDQNDHDIRWWSFRKHTKNVSRNNEILHNLFVNTHPAKKIKKKNKLGWNYHNNVYLLLVWRCIIIT